MRKELGEKSSVEKQKKPRKSYYVKLTSEEKERRKAERRRKAKSGEIYDKVINGAAERKARKPSEKVFRKNQKILTLDCSYETFHCLYDIVYNERPKSMSSVIEDSIEYMYNELRSKGMIEE